MKKLPKIFFSIILIISIVLPGCINVFAAPVTNTTPVNQTSAKEYYNLQDGLYTKKSVSGINSDGTYDVKLESYTSDVSVMSNQKNVDVDLTFVIDMSSSMNDRVSGKTKISIAKETLNSVFNNLVNNSGIGTENKNVNVSIVTFSTGTQTRLEWAGLKSEGDGFTQSIEDTIDDLSPLLLFAITNPDKGLDEARTLIKKRIEEHPQNIQKLIFITDGSPAGLTLTTDVNKNQTINRSSFSNAISIANDMKSFGVGIYCMGFDTGTETDSTNIEPNGLKKWVVSGYGKNSLGGEGTQIRVRQMELFLNVISSNWLLKSGKSLITFDSASYDNSSAADRWNKYSVNENIPYYQQWAKSSDSWQNIPDYFTLNENISENGYFLGGSDSNSISSELQTLIINALTERYTCQGSLLKDYTIQDTVSDYFDIDTDSVKAYKVDYAPNLGKYEFSTITGETNINYQYGENSREWDDSSRQDITNSLTISKNSKSVAITGADTNIIDKFKVVDNNVTDEEHSGSKLVIEFKIKPKDSFMGGKEVSTNIFNESGIFKVENGNKKCIQSFSQLSIINGEEKLDNTSPIMIVPLVDGTLTLGDDNVQIGLIYRDIMLGNNNACFTFNGRNSENKYVYKFNQDKACNTVFLDNSEVTYSEDTAPCDYVSLYIASVSPNEYNNSCVVSNGVYTQFKGTGIKKTGSTYSKDNIIGTKLYYLEFNNMNIGQRFKTYNSTGVDPEATIYNGIVNNTLYTLGYPAIKQYAPTFKINVWVPEIKLSDTILNSTASYNWPVSSSSVTTAFNNFTTKNVANNSVDKNTLAYATATKNTENNASYEVGNNMLMTDLINFNQVVSDDDYDGINENVFALLKVQNNQVVKDDSIQNFYFAIDALDLQSDYLGVQPYIKTFADKAGNTKGANDSIEEGDKFSLALSYTNKKFTDFISTLNASDTDFVYTFDEVYITDNKTECTYCKDSFVPQYLGYQAQIHIANNAIIVQKTGCDANHLNESFVFSVVGFKANEDKTKADTSTATIVANLTIQGNGVKTINVTNLEEYEYFCIIEDTGVNENNAWTWDYDKISINGTNPSTWNNLSTNIFHLTAGESKTLVVNNEYDETNSSLHYSSGYCSNILSSGKQTTFNSSHSTITKEVN